MKPFVSGAIDFKWTIYRLWVSLHAQLQLDIFFLKGTIFLSYQIKTSEIKASSQTFPTKT